METTIEESLSELTQYYISNNLHANPDKTQVTAFHLRNKEAKRMLKLKWNRTLDLTLSYKQHLHNTKMKVVARNNILRKMSRSRHINAKMIGHISANKRFKYTKHKNHYLIQKQYPLYILLISARLIKYIVKTQHMSIRTSKSKEYHKVQVANNKLIKKHFDC